MCPPISYHASADPGPVATPGPYTAKARLHVFPLLARTAQLQSICDKFLNVPDPFMVFKPVGFAGRSVISLMVASYTDAVSQSDDTGVGKENELLFAFPVEGRRVSDGHSRLYLLTPYILLDNTAAAGSGRENFGWPKLGAQFAGSIEGALLQMSALVVDQVGVGEVFEIRRLIQLTHHHCFSIQTFRQGFTGGWSDYLDELSYGKEGFFHDPRAEMVGQTLSLFTGPTLHCINLKQFRDETSPAMSEACYQSLVDSEMTIDLASGFTVHASPLCNWYTLEVFRRGNLPIVQELGLLTTSSYTTIGGIHVDRVEPLFPFRVDLEATYPLAKRICWRGIPTTNAWQS